MKDHVTLKIQWLANREAGQLRGNRQKIIQIGDDQFASYVSRFSGDRYEPFWLWRTGGLIDVLSPFLLAPEIGVSPDPGCRCYAITFNSFASKAARKWGSWADSDLYPLKREVAK